MKYSNHNHESVMKKLENNRLQKEKQPNVWHSFLEATFELCLPTSEFEWDYLNFEDVICKSHIKK